MVFGRLHLAGRFVEMSASIYHQSHYCITELDMTSRQQWGIIVLSNVICTYALNDTRELMADKPSLPILAAQVQNP